MEYITMIMSGLALLAAIVCLILIIQEKKRNQKRNADLVNYVEYEYKAVKDDICIHEENYSARLEGLARGVRHNSTNIDNISTKVDNLEKGIVPDYQEALAAKNSVDEFNRGLSAIMGFDPMEAARRSRQERMGAESE